MEHRKNLKKIVLEFMKKEEFHNKDSELLLIVGTLALVKITQEKITGVKRPTDLIKKYKKDMLRVSRILEINVDLKFNFNEKEFKKLIEIFNDTLEKDLENIISWTYQYSKHEKERAAFENSLQKGIKIEGDNIVTTTQFFTEDYMIEYLINEIFKEYEDVSKIKVLDPCCGGGNFITKVMEYVYSNLCNLNQFDSFIDHCLFGYELDKNLAKVANLNLYLKYISLTGIKRDIKFNIFTSNLDNISGSLKKNSQEYLYNSSSKKVVTYNEVFKQNFFDVVITNPPFMGSRNMDKVLLSFLKNNYPNSRGDLCNSFIERCLFLTKEKGYTGLVTQNSWLYLTTYKNLRKKIFSEVQINKIVELGSDAFLDLNGEKTRIVLSVIKKESPKKNLLSVNLSSLKFEEKIRFINSINSTSYQGIDQLSILSSKDITFKHASTDRFETIFNELSTYSEFATPMQGTSTGDNTELVDYSWNHPNDKDWLLVSKGGGYAKWNGLNFYRVKWGDDAKYIKAKKGHALRNIKYFEKTQLVYSDTGTRGMSVRTLLPGQIFIASGPGIRIEKGYKFAHLAFLNSKVANYFLSIISPKLTVSAGYIGKIPVPEKLLFSSKLSMLGEKCFNIKHTLSGLKIDNYEFKSETYSNKNSDTLLDTILYELNLELRKIKYENEIEKLVYEFYDFTESEKNFVDLKFGPSVLEFSKEIDFLNIKKIDSEWSKSLNNACGFKGTGSKRKFGVDSILEHLSQIYNVHPENLFHFISKNIELFNKVIAKYRNDELHKKILIALEYEHHFCKKKSYALENLNFKKDEIEWLQKEFEEFHKATFKGTTLVKVSDNIIEYAVENKVD
ncbi:N-6 DNA methylase [Exiguobacterium mexicanum]